MILESLLPFFLGGAAGFYLGEKGRRAKVLAKLNQWTAPKKEPPKEPAK